MTISSLQAARTLCELRNWSLSNLQIQKILYLAHMFYLGQNGDPLIDESFEAWDYGPVIPSVYRNASGFGSGAVTGCFLREKPAVRGTPEYQMIEDAAESTKGITAGRLVAITHRDEGAWAKNYKPDVRGIKIPNSDILDEYRGLGVTT